MSWTCEILHSSWTLAAKQQVTLRHRLAGPVAGKEVIQLLICWLAIWRLGYFGSHSRLKFRQPVCYRLCLPHLDVRCR